MSTAPAAAGYHPGMRGWVVRIVLLMLTTSGAVPAGFATVDDAELDCLARTLYWEAKSEGRDGMVAVGWVVLNRQQSPEFPDGLCEVVYQGGETPPCQFSWWCDGKSDRPREADNWALAREVAALLLDEPPPDPTDGALFFHHSGIETPWRVPRTRTARIGGHVFYR